MKPVCNALLGGLCSFLTCLVTSHATEIVGPNTTWSYFKGRTEASAANATAWRQPGYNDSAWQTGKAPFYYGEPYIGTELTDMRGAYTAVFFRHVFTVSSPGSIGTFTMNVLADDGFVVWLNGTEIGRYNVSEGDLPVHSTALGALEEPLGYQEISVQNPWKLLVPGDNVLAVQAFNSSLSDSSDFAFLAHVTIEADTTPPTLTERIPPPNSTVDSLVQLEINFSEPVSGVDAADLLVNGIPATGLERRTPTQFVFGFLEPGPGSVEFRWADSHGITDTLGSPQPFAGSSWAVTLNPLASRGKVYISEFMADTDKAVYDDDCDPADWIELHNAGTTSVNLGGWSLTDDPDEKTKWRFPSYELGPDAYLVVFATQKNKTTMPSRVVTSCRNRSSAFPSFHTNFKLSASGEYLALVAPDGEVVSAFSPRFPAQSRDVSYGRVPGAGEQFGYFTLATPRAINAQTGSGFSPGVQFSRSSGTITGPFALTLETVDTNAVIRYTIDGSFPAETNRNLLTYTAPLQIANTLQVRARAYSPGSVPGPPSSETYVLLTDSIPHLASFTSSLPVIIITTLKSASISGTRNTPVHLSLYEPKNGLTSLRRPPNLVSRAGIKTRGSSTGGQAQSNFAVDIWDEFDQDKDVKLLGMPEDSEWVLYAPSGFDPMMIHNAFTMELSAQMNFSAPRTRFVEVYLNKGGAVNSNQWFGLYVLMEKPGLSKGRIDAPKAQPEDVDFPEVTGSYMFKTDRLDDGDTGFNAGGTANAFVEPKEREMKSPQRAPQLAYLTKYWRDMQNAMSVANPNRRDPVLGYRAYLEVTNWMDFHLLETLSGQVDAIRLSTYYYKPRNGKVEYGPRWDYDRAWESKDDGRDDNPRVWDTGGGLYGAPWWNTLLRDVDAWQLWVDRWEHHRRGPLSLANMYSVIDRMTNEVRWVQPREVKRWPETAPRGGYANETRIMKTWISNRVSWIDAQLARPPRLSSSDAVVTPGFKLDLTVPTGISNPNNVSMYYTLDGTDPRGSTGAIGPSAFQYSGPITITTNTRVIARLIDKARIQRGPPSTTPWSGQVTATFVVTPPPLALTEIMFHPDAPVGSPYAPGDFEYLELKNVSNRELNLVGYHFNAGIEFTFTATNAVTSLAPGERVLVIRNRAAFLSRYPGISRIAGEFAGSLDDAGERLSLAGPAEEPIFDFSYRDSWYRMADGTGFSLVAINENLASTALGQPNAWRLSAAAGGSPGAVDGTPIVVPRVVINEVLPRTAPVAGEAQIELANLENTTTDVSGWYISDSFGEPRKVRLPSGTRILRNGIIVLREAVFNLPNGEGFRLSTKGDDIWIFSADREGALTGYYHGFSFGPSEPAQSFGRFVISTGEESFLIQKSPTMGAINAGPAVGPVVFSEILFQPPTSGIQNNTVDEFVELLNTSNVLVPLFDLANATNTWRLRGGIDFDFPRNFALPPFGRVLLVGFDPILEPATLESFQRRMGFDLATPIVGPWQGTLANGSDTLRLLRPGTPVVDSQNGSVSMTHITVEELTYRDQTPWPTQTSGTGRSLTRRDFATYGGDPMAWLASPRLSPGIDADSDGLPDAWEIQHSLATNSAVGENGPDGDPDGDGFLNRHELLNGTNPKDASSAIQLGVSFGAGNIVNLMLAASPGRKFRIESRSATDQGTWSILREIQVPGNGIAVLASEPAASESHYYRASLVP
jgi:hypothetical protein